MANIATVLKEEILRLARKEIRSEVTGLKKASAQYRTDIAALKRRVVALEQQLSRLEKATPQSAEVMTVSDTKSKVRFVAKGFKSLRQRLGLSAEVIGALLDVSAQTIYGWESGRSSPRKQQMPKIAMLRGLSKREVRAILEKLTG